ncbi:MAG TPA: exopolysaccharide biosynthesis polyprenyl glycosylphosphotransferase [Vicinamibacteria bacterium]
MSAFAVQLRPTERVLLLGTSPLALQLAEELSSHPHVRVLGVVDDALAPASLPVRLQRLGALHDLGRILHEQRPTRVIVTLTARRGRLPVRLLLKARLRGVQVEDGLETYERLAGKLAIEALPPSALIFSKGLRKSPLLEAFSRVMSVLVAAVGLLALLPLLAVVAALIALDSPGPVLFAQDRVGARGRRFKLLKFRTMLAVHATTSEWAADNGSRITRVGKWLRRFRLDELPQLVNVLRGEMNLVGPRPHPVSNFDLFLHQIPYYWIRSSVLPGITGWAQVRYRYANNLEEETEKMRYDLYYIKHMSWWLDLRILAETLKVVLFGHPAAAPSTARVVPIASRPHRLRPRLGTLAARTDTQPLGWRRA